MAMFHCFDRYASFKYALYMHALLIFIIRYVYQICRLQIFRYVYVYHTLLMFIIRYASYLFCQMYIIPVLLSQVAGLVWLGLTLATS